MSDKKIPLYLGEGKDRLLIGRAEVEKFEDGSMKVNGTIEAPDWGFWGVIGLNPVRLVGFIPVVHKKGD